MANANSKDTTQVKISKTTITYFDRKNGEEKSIPVIGFVTLKDAKSMVAEIDKTNLFLEKKTENETFRVNSNDLYAMKIPETKEEKSKETVDTENKK